MPIYTMPDTEKYKLPTDSSSPFENLLASLYNTAIDSNEPDMSLALNPIMAAGKGTILRKLSQVIRESAKGKLTEEEIKPILAQAMKEAKTSLDRLPKKELRRIGQVSNRGRLEERALKQLRTPGGRETALSLEKKRMYFPHTSRADIYPAGMASRGELENLLNLPKGDVLKGRALIQLSPEIQPGEAATTLTHEITHNVIGTKQNELEEITSTASKTLHRLKAPQKWGPNPLQKIEDLTSTSLHDEYELIAELGGRVLMGDKYTLREAVKISPDILPLLQHIEQSPLLKKGVKVLNEP